MAAGEDGVEEDYSSPSSLAAEPGFEHLMSIGASAVRQGADMRAIFGGASSVEGTYEGQPCDPADVLVFLPSSPISPGSTEGLSSSSNCGTAVTMACTRAGRLGRW